MKNRFGWWLGGLVLLAAGFGYLRYQDTLMPVPLASEAPRFVAGAPEYGEDAAVIEALLPAGEKLEAFLANQCDLTLLDRDASGQLVGQLLSAVAGARHGRRWQLKVQPGWTLQEGFVLNARRLAEGIRPEVTGKGGELRVVDEAVVELRFPVRQADLPNELLHWRLPGSGPFQRKGTTLTRFQGFKHGRTGLARVEVAMDSAMFESHAWAQSLAAGRWAFSVFPGSLAPEDMAMVRVAPYDEVRMKDGTVWFLSRRMRRLRPDPGDWSRTRLFGVWKGAMDLPYDPLGS